MPPGRINFSSKRQDLKEKILQSSVRIIWQSISLSKIKLHNLILLLVESAGGKIQQMKNDSNYLSNYLVLIMLAIVKVNFLQTIGPEQKASLGKTNNKLPLPLFLKNIVR